MRSLFLKIFVWFWGAMALVGGVLVVSILLQQGRQPPPPPPFAQGHPFGSGLERRRAFTGHSFARQARQAVDVYGRAGAEGVERFLEDLRKATGVESAFFDAEGRQLAGEAAAEASKELAQRALESGEIEFQGSWSGLLVAAGANDREGSRFALVGLLPRRLLGWGFDPGDLALRFLAVLITGGVLCYGLARYLTAPMSKLQRAARLLASGNLKARVEPGLGRRGDEFGDLGRDFDRMAERIEELVTSQQRLLGDISHELRSPLARLAVALELARKKGCGEAAASLDRIEREAERMNGLIGQLLQLTRLEAGDGADWDAETVDLGSLLRETASDADFEASNRRRSVRLHRFEDCRVRGSTPLLRSALENIVRNAARHTAEGTEVEISMAVQPGEGGEERVRVLVRDHGPGVPPEALPRLFRPFYRVEDARDRQSGGVGLGLAIAERIIRRHGGEVRAGNADGGGLEVEILLPSL